MKALIGLAFLLLLSACQTALMPVPNPINPTAPTPSFFPEALVKPAGTLLSISALPASGQNSDDVKGLQAQLNSVGSSPVISVDGSYGPSTALAISSFQRKKGLKVGPLDASTLAALNVQIAKVPSGQVKLDWEKGHPERAVWTKVLLDSLNEKFVSFDSASDSSFFCSKISKLSKEQKLQVWATMFAWTAYYESGWNTASNSQDVGTASNKDTWSVGLLQLSVVDGPNKSLGYNFWDLQTGPKNLILGIAIMAKQIDRHGKLLISKGNSGVYWSTLSPNGKYDKSAKIAVHTRALEFCR